MALESEIRGDTNQIKITSTNRWTKTVISLSLSFIAGLSIFLLLNTIYMVPSQLVPSPPAISPTSQSAAEPVDAVALCKAGVIKYTPLGAYPGGSHEVIAALNYCNSLG